MRQPGSRSDVALNRTTILRRDEACPALLPRPRRLIASPPQGLRLADGVDMRALRSAFGVASADSVVAALAEHAPALATLRGAGGAALAPAHAAARQTAFCCQTASWLPSSRGSDDECQ